MTCAEFEKMYDATWYREYFIPQLYKLFDPLIKYTEPINSRIFKKVDLLTNDKKKRFSELRHQYTIQAMFLEVTCYNILFFDKLKDMFYETKITLELPLRTNSALTESNCFQESILNCRSYEELLSELTQYITLGINELDNLFGERVY